MEPMEPVKPVTSSEISRRRLLGALGAAGVLGAVPTRWASAAEAEAGAARLISNTVEVFAGSVTSNSRTETGGKLAAVERAARAALASMDAAGGDGELFAGVPLGTSDPNLNTTY